MLTLISKQIEGDYWDYKQKWHSENERLFFVILCLANTVHNVDYQEALENLDQTEEVFYYLCPVCGNIEKLQPEKCSICGVPGDKFIKY